MKVYVVTLILYHCEGVIIKEIFNTREAAFDYVVQQEAKDGEELDIQKWEVSNE
jgi:hypothetical protein